MLREWQKRDWLVWLGWLAISSIGWFVCLISLAASSMATADNPSGNADNLLPRDIWSFVIFLAVLWSIVGMGQWLLLRVYVGRSFWWLLWWMLTCAVGWTGFWLLLFAYPKGLYSFRIPIVELLGGLGISLLQWSILRFFLQRAGWWIIVTPGAVALAIVIVQAYSWILFKVFGGASNLLSLDIFIPGIIYGAITGYFLITFLKKA